jgi:hypothetical protein
MAMRRLTHAQNKILLAAAKLAKAKPGTFEP